MAKNLVIVESPAKAKTIENFLGKDFTVKSSFGHVRDLVKKGMAVDTDKGFAPVYEISPDKERVIAELKKLAKAADIVWLATDEDREGEAISWHLSEALNLDEKKTRRIVFHEITKTAILKAIDSPRKIDKHLVDAQQARRILDRLVGFELSPILWKKIKPSLSAGRVQSVTVRLIVEREREIMSFKSTSSYKVSAIFTSGGQKFKAELRSNFKSIEEARAFLQTCSKSTFKVTSLETKPARKSPSAPFTTSTLQQDASRKLGFSPKRTMVVAQRLYESGKITYMRTDSVNLSEMALEKAKEVVTKMFGAKYVNIRHYKTKSKGAQEAHEAIRPTYLEQNAVDGERDEQRLYDLIWKRTVASQMAEAELEKTTAVISVSGASETFVAQGEVIKFDGFLAVYMESSDEDDGSEDGKENSEAMLPALKTGQTLDSVSITATQRYTHHPARYTEAALVKKLEELGIGRPSTYAPTISTVQDRGYVVKEEREGKPRNYDVLILAGGKIKEEVRTENTGAEKNKLFPSDIGMVVTDFLQEHFPKIMDYHFTASVEEEFDDIAEGKVNWKKMLESFYRPFHSDVEKTEETSERASGERELGVDPVSGKRVFVRIGRFGPLVQIGDSEDPEKKFASLRKDMRLETITFEDAMELFKLPRTVGNYREKEMIIGIGRFGPYVKWGEQYISIPRGEDPLKVTPERAIELVQQKELADAPIAQYKGLPVTKGKGRFGPFIKYNELFINISKAYDYDNLSEKDIAELIDKKLEKESNRYIQQWPEEKIALENGRWGPFIRFGKDMLKIGRTAKGEKITPEEVAELSLEQVKKMIVDQKPGAFDKKGAKKGAAKKVAKAPAKAAAKVAVKRSFPAKRKAPSPGTKTVIRRGASKKAKAMKKKR
jgi:DNA topoisomerase-1